MKATKTERVVREEVFGHPTDFLISTAQENGSVCVTITAVLPALRRDASGLVRSLRPPLYPWDGVP